MALFNTLNQYSLSLLEQVCACRQSILLNWVWCSNPWDDNQTWFWEAFLYKTNWKLFLPDWKWFSQYRCRSESWLSDLIKKIADDKAEKDCKTIASINSVRQIITKWTKCKMLLFLLSHRIHSESKWYNSWEGCKEYQEMVKYLQAAQWQVFLSTLSGKKQTEQA